ncbi:MAG: pantetheine-phosphate adenylyltransferase [Candidatus Eremiobacteraeota bacterium]|nr:pantetheine-phosphate adenylyltransferase [Candidatus Eremiobacteraeota bacterium]MBV8366641.1 pantetheine-phosphate adenylyltransferase [Candidatus Eremiobacteraeota bacterium]
MGKTSGIVVVYPGSFDPVTFGHLDIVRRAAAQFTSVTVAVVANPSKSPMFSLAERVEMLREACAGLRNVEIDSFEGLLVDYVRRFERALIIKGLRIVSDFEHEFSMALLNRKLKGGAETIFMPASAEFAYVSSSSVKEVFALGGDVAEFVPKSVLRHMLARRRKGKR